MTAISFFLDNKVSNVSSFDDLRNRKVKFNTLLFFNFNFNLSLFLLARSTLFFFQKKYEINYNFGTNLV